MRGVCAQPRGGLIDRKGEPTKAKSSGVRELRVELRAPCVQREQTELKGMIESLLRHAGVPKVAPAEDDLEA